MVGSRLNSFSFGDGLRRDERIVRRNLPLWPTVHRVRGVCEGTKLSPVTEGFAGYFSRLRKNGLRDLDSLQFPVIL